MEILITSMGRWKSSPEKDLFNSYASRLPWPLELRELELREIPDIARQKKQEAEKLLDSCHKFKAERIISLDETGKNISSKELAKIIGEWKDTGLRRSAWIIGGHAGLDKSVLEQSHLVISLGKMTWPHLLVRTLLAEQLYRGYSIINNHPYNRE